jgi:peptidoglycan/LPS O-acetylase OafA/YrhL
LSKQLGHIPHLDSLRTIAVSITLLTHWLPDLGFKPINLYIDGVSLFFTISGFLITSILLKQKEEINNKLLIAKNFFIKRILRAC